MKLKPGEWRLKKRPHYCPHCSERLGRTPYVMIDGKTMCAECARVRLESGVLIPHHSMMFRPADQPR